MDIKGIIIAPAYTRDHPMDRFKILFDLLSEEMGFILHWWDVWSPSVMSLLSDVDVVLAYGLPGIEMAMLDKKIKLISMVGDAHTRIKEKREQRNKIWQRADSIWTFADEIISNSFPQWYHKHVWIPMFFAGHDRYVSLPFNENPKMKCLLSGCAHLPWYPLRYYVRMKGNRKLIDRSDWYLVMKDGKVWRYEKDAYAKWLNSYFCNVTCTGDHDLSKHLGEKYEGGGLHAKQMEIPATGSLLLSDNCKDMERVGFVPGKNFVDVGIDDVLDKITYCLKHPGEFAEVRKAGMEFVRANHSVKNRVREMKRVIERICNEEEVGGESCVLLS